MDTSDLAKRMKDYESVPKIRLMKRCPVICRIDGKAHHNFTRGFKRPFDEIYIKSMQETAKYLCENIQGVVLSYQQSDEITLVMIDYEKLNTSPYFDYEVQKLCSIIASMATMAFNRFFLDNVDWFYHKEFYEKGLDNLKNFNTEDEWDELDTALARKYDVYYKKIYSAMFDARVFNIPKEEVTNLVYWRQLDAIRNSIQMVGQANFSHKELQGMGCDKIVTMLDLQKGIIWDKLPLHQQRGSCCIKKTYYPKAKPGYENCEVDATKVRTKWVIDENIPLFKNEGREYIEKLI